MFFYSHEYIDYVKYSREKYASVTDYNLIDKVQA